MQVLAGQASSQTGNLVDNPHAGTASLKNENTTINFLYLQPYIFELSIQQTWLWFATIDQIQNLTISPIWPLLTGEADFYQEGHSSRHTFVEADPGIIVVILY